MTAFQTKWILVAAAVLLSVPHSGGGNFATNQQLSCEKGPNVIGSGGCGSKVSNMFLDTAELVVKNGYPVETHTVTTEDGYLLTVHRIPGSPKASLAGVKTPVLIQHGILSASDFWVAAGPDNALAYLLADRGYDVWMGNARGNVYSRKHKTLSPKEPKFWNFSWHEMGVYDLPAVIDYILAATNHTQLFYIGHSMGCTMFFVLTSSRPEYNQKIRFMVALAPVVIYKVIRNPVVKLLLPYTETIYRGIVNARQEEMLPRVRIWGRFLEEACSDGRPLQSLCQVAYYAAYGNDGALLNKTMLPEYFFRVQSGMSLKTLYHFVQIINTGRFQVFDRSGKMDRLMPEYNLAAVSAPVSLVYAHNDIWADRAGVVPLSKRIRNVVKIVRLPDDRLNHNGFGFSINVKGLINDEVIQLLATN